MSALLITIEYIRKIQDSMYCLATILHWMVDFCLLIYIYSSFFFVFTFIKYICTQYTLDLWVGRDTEERGWSQDLIKKTCMLIQHLQCHCKTKFKFDKNLFNYTNPDCNSCLIKSIPDLNMCDFSICDGG